MAIDRINYCVTNFAKVFINRKIKKNYTKIAIKNSKFSIFFFYKILGDFHLI